MHKYSETARDISGEDGLDYLDLDVGDGGEHPRHLTFDA